MGLGLYRCRTRAPRHSHGYQPWRPGFSGAGSQSWRCSADNGCSGWSNHGDTMGTLGFLIWWLFTSLPSSDSTSLWHIYFDDLPMEVGVFFHSQNWQRGHQKNNFDGEHDDKRLDLGVPSSLFHLLSITSDFIATMSPWMIFSKRNRLLLPKLLLSKWWCMYIYIYTYTQQISNIYIYILDTYNI